MYNPSDFRSHIVRGPIDGDSLGSGWQYVEVPPRGYGDEPLGFMVKISEGPRKSYMIDFDDYEPVSRFRQYDPSVIDSFESIQHLPRQVPIPQSSGSLRRRAEQSSYKDYIPVTLPEYDNRSHIKPKKPAPTIPMLEKAKSSRLGQFPRRRRFSEPTMDKYDEKSLRFDMKLQSLDRALLRMDLETTLHSAYVNRISKTVKSKRGYNLAEFQRLDRKQDQISKSLNDFKRNFAKPKH